MTLPTAGLPEVVASSAVASAATPPTAFAGLLQVLAGASEGVPQVVVAPLLVALVTAIGTLLVRSAPRLQRSLAVTGSVAYLVAVVWLLGTVTVRGTVTYQLSAWPAPFGITLVADPLAGFMLAFTAALSLAAVVYSVVYVDRFGQRLSYHPLYQLMVVGVTGSFLTGDLFNLFVWFEVMLMASYVLVVFYSGPEHTRAALQYVVLNLLGSALMLVAIGGLYATTGTLNMADMARRVAAPASYGIDPAPVVGLSAALFVVFALKAGIVPFQFWVPAAYRAAPPPVSAMLAGVVKKVGIYAIVRLYFTVFAPLTLPGGLPFGLRGDLLAFYGPVLLAMAVASILLGGLAAVGRPDLDGLLAHSSIGQIGFVVLPLGIAAVVTDPDLRLVCVAAALVYALNHAIAKGLLFFASGAIQQAVGTGEFESLGGLSERAPVLAGAFLAGGLALVGIPPLSGFFGKFLVFDAAGRASAAGYPSGVLALAVALTGAVLTIAYVTKAWNAGFWGEPSDAVLAASRQPVLVAVVAVLALALLVLGVGFDPVLEGARAAAAAALDTEQYVAAVDPGTFTPANASAGANGTGGGVSHALDASGIGGGVSHALDASGTGGAEAAGHGLDAPGGDGR